MKKERGNESSYARHRGQFALAGSSTFAVKNAIKTGRISLDDDGLITYAKADAQWAASTGNAGGDHELNAALDGPSAAALLNQLRAKREQLKIDEIEGRLIDAAKVADEAFTIGRTVRDAMRSIPARLSAQLAALDDPAAIERAMMIEIDKALEALSGE